MDWEKKCKIKQEVCTVLVRWLPCIAVLALCLWHRHINAEDGTPIADTIVEYKTRTIVKVDTLLLSPPIAPLMFIQLPADTIRIEEPITLHRVQATYEDSLYRAVVSGYIDARLDSIALYPRTKTEYVERIIFVTPRKRWGLGLQAGYGLNGWYSGVGVSYNLFSW